MAKVYGPRDIVKCPRVGKGLFKIIDTRTKSTLEAQIQSLDDPTLIDWVYTSILVTDKDTLRASLTNRVSEAKKILDKTQHKR